MTRAETKARYQSARDEARVLAGALNEGVNAIADRAGIPIPTSCRHHVQVREHAQVQLLPDGAAFVEAWILVPPPEPATE